MKLTSEKAKELIKSFQGKTGNDAWIFHSITVGDCAHVIAKALKDQGMDIDVDKATTLGYIHDIGKFNGESMGHVMRGYQYIIDLGFDEEYANICLTHSYLNNDVMCTAGGIPRDIPFRSQFIKNHYYTIEEKIVNLCDLMCPSGDEICTVDKRLISIMIRKGTYENTQYHIREAYKLKEYFDNLLGYNLYDLFPEIKDNL